jgi:hypothetical protein
MENFVNQNDLAAQGYAPPRSSPVDFQRTQSALLTRPMGGVAKLYVPLELKKRKIYASLFINQTPDIADEYSIVGEITLLNSNLIVGRIPVERARSDPVTAHQQIVFTQNFINLQGDFTADGIHRNDTIIVQFPFPGIPGIGLPREVYPFKLSGEIDAVSFNVNSMQNLDSYTVFLAVESCA